MDPGQEQLADGGLCDPARNQRGQRPSGAAWAAGHIEACGLAPNIAGAPGARAGLFECGEVRVHPTGSVTVFTGSAQSLVGA